MAGYGRVVSAALAETRSKFALAEALALDIPPRRPGPSEDAAISEYLADARRAIIDAGGEERSVGTLANYRFTALWVSDVNVTNFEWVEGASFTAHQEARQAGMTVDEFAAMPSPTIDAIRRHAGKAGTDGPSNRIAASWSEEQKIAAAREILSDPKVAAGALRDIPTRARMYDAARTVEDDQVQEADRRHRSNASFTARQNDTAKAFSDLTTANDRVMRALKTLQETELDDQSSALLHAVLERLENSVGWLSSFVHSGDRSFDESLDRLLAEGGR